MSYAESSYLQQLKALLPRGALWERLREPGKLFGELLAVFAAEFARVDESNATLLDEADPRTTTQLLPEWEAFASLPTTCSPENMTIAERQAALTQRLTGATVVSRTDIIQLAASLGLVITITEHSANRYGDSYGRSYGGREWYFVWDVTYAGPANALLECAISSVAPAGWLLRFNVV